MNKITLLSIVLLGLVVLFLMYKIREIEKQIGQQREILEEYKKVVRGEKWDKFV